MDDVVWTSVFADGPGGGNPCPVVFGAAAWSSEQMQAGAARFGAETVYVLPPERGGDVRYRYFVPRHEMEMCVHATVAASVVVGGRGELPHSPAAVETPLGVLDVRWDAAAGAATVTQFPPVFGAELTAAERDRVVTALCLPPDALGDGPLRSVSTARAKLMVPVRDEAALDALAPDFEALWEVCEALGVTGCYPYTTAAAGADVATRQFPVRAGYVEDPATGVAACALGALLAMGSDCGWHRYRIAQGRALGRPSLILAEALTDRSGAVMACRVGGTMQQVVPDGRRL
jgi:trans-2,3-dihydro-3-hydroxyanthranilate isomerase